MYNHKLRRALLCLFATGSLTMSAQVALDFNLGKRGPEIGNEHYGIFFEEINHAGDGGLYAELIRNRSFEDDSTKADYWSVNGGASMTLTRTGLMNSAQNEALAVTFSGSNSGIRNAGFWGMKFEKDSIYRLTFWAKANGSQYNGDITCQLLSKQGEVCGKVIINGPFSTTWTKHTATIIATAAAGDGSFGLAGSASGNMTFDMVSLFPPTFKGRENGCRTDLAQKLADLHPGFIRFPGGCYVEGSYSNNQTNRFEWKKTIGPIETRPGHQNANWGYRVSDGMGFHEFLQLCEDLNAQPLFVANIGIGHGWCQDYQQIDSFIQEALDAIEYANGDETTTYGKMRIANGHKEPFNLNMIEIGNENYNYNASSNTDQSDHYAERYHAFYTAIKAKYPDMKLIGNVEAWSTDNPTWRNSYPVEMVDEHYYRNSGWFINNYNKYDSYSRLSYKVYTGEYAVTSNYGANGNLNAALGEAVFMEGMENNSDVCAMTSYAPLFVNENNQKWKPDLIRFNANTSYVTPSYYVQKLFADNVGKTNVKWTERNNVLLTQKEEKIGVASWLSNATYDNVTVTDQNGNSLINESFDNADNWTNGTGTWKCSGGTYSQTDENVKGATAIYRTPLKTDTYTYTVDATKNSGKEGFLIIFNYQDANNYNWWNIGGWGNTKFAVEQCVNGSKTTLASVSGSITTGQTYRIKIASNGSNIKCYIDDKLIHDIILPASTKGVYVASSVNDESKKMYIKLVNTNNSDVTTKLSFKNGTVTDGDAVLLTSASYNDENTISNQDKVAPSSETVTVGSNDTIYYTAPAFSVNILRLNTKDIHIVNDETTSAVPTPMVKYSFEKGAVDDNRLYQGDMKNGASIVAMEDGNHAMSSGAINGGGYMDLGTSMAPNVLGQMSDNYSISIDILNHSNNNLDKYCWGYALTNGTTDYIGLVNTSGNTNWYYEIKNGDTKQNVKSGVGLAPEAWNNFTFVQNGKNGYVYIDGILAATGNITLSPAEFASSLTNCFIGKSPYAKDAVMENALFDNFQIFDQSLNANQVKSIYAETAKMSTSALSSAIKAIKVDNRNVSGDIFNTNGTLVSKDADATKSKGKLKKGIYIVDGQKEVIR